MNKSQIKNRYEIIRPRYRTVGKLGLDSLFTTIPKSIVTNLNIKQGDVLKILQESNKIILQKAE